MSKPRGAMGSSYMNWAKTRSEARFNLATSGMPNLPLNELLVSLDDLEITDGGYGYDPLMRLIASSLWCRHRIDRDGRRDFIRESPRNRGTD